MVVLNHDGEKCSRRDDWEGFRSNDPVSHRRWRLA
jgi:hypothetical protein